jgi:hypothetical protein
MAHETENRQPPETVTDVPAMLPRADLPMRPATVKGARFRATVRPAASARHVKEANRARMARLTLEPPAPATATEKRRAAVAPLPTGPGPSWPAPAPAPRDPFGTAARTYAAWRRQAHAWAKAQRNARRARPVASWPSRGGRLTGAVARRNLDVQQRAAAERDALALRLAGPRGADSPLVWGRRIGAATRRADAMLAGVVVTPRVTATLTPDLCDDPAAVAAPLGSSLADALAPAAFNAMRGRGALRAVRFDPRRSLAAVPAALRACTLAAVPAPTRRA